MESIFFIPPLSPLPGSISSNAPEPSAQKPVTLRDTGKAPVAQAPVSDMPLNNHQLKQIRAQCLVFLAFRNGLAPKTSHLEIALGNFFSEEAGPCRNLTEHKGKQQSISDPGRFLEGSRTCGALDHSRSIDRLPSGTPSAGTHAEAKMVKESDHGTSMEEEKSQNTVLSEHVEDKGHHLNIPPNSNLPRLQPCKQRKPASAVNGQNNIVMPVKEPDVLLRSVAPAQELDTEEEDAAATTDRTPPEYTMSEKWILEGQKRKFCSDKMWELKQRKTEQRIAVNCCAEEQNIGVQSSPRNETCLFGARIGFSEVRGLKQLDSSSQQTVKENCIVKQKIGVGSPSRIGSLGVISRQADQPPEQLMTQVCEVKEEDVASGELDEVSGSRKQVKVRTLDTEYGISREVLEQHSGKKLKDVAVVLGVSRSTLKRICRKCGIFRWPPSKVKRHDHQEFVQATRRSIEESSQRTQPVSVGVSFVPLENVSSSQMLTTPEPKVMQDDSSIMVKAAYKDDIIKFRLLLSSRKVDLVKEVAMRLNLSVGSFKIKYLDEDDDWVLIACDADLKTCISSSISLGKTTIKMLIEVPSDNPHQN